MKLKADGVGGDLNELVEFPLASGIIWTPTPITASQGRRVSRTDHEGNV